MSVLGRIAAGALLTMWVLVNGVLDARAEEKFLDEAGRVIYTIDNDGVVSMFENSPTDLTISVTRGTREEMKPLVTEVVPRSVPAGASVQLKLEGKNLVGASVKMSVPGIDVKAFSAKPQIIEIPLQIAANVPPGEVIVEVTTPIGSTKTSFKVTELQLGGASPSRRDAVEKQKVGVGAPTACPQGMVGVAAERGGFCIELDQTFSGDVRKAEKTCAGAGARLCSASEWRTACEKTKEGILPLKNMIGDWEWTGTNIVKAPPGESPDYGAAGDLNALLLGQSDCITNREHPLWKNEPIAGRCCK
jgi:hypothetical protein